jgi:hypothetical protein
MSNALDMIIPIEIALRESNVNQVVLNPESVQSMKIKFETEIGLDLFTAIWIKNGATYKSTKREGLILEIFINN